MKDLAFRSATELAAAVKTKEVSSRELLDTYLARVEKHNPAINSVITLDESAARAAAAEADRMTAQGDSLGAVHGLPITIKDALETKGMRSTGGAIEMMNHVPDQDAPVVGRLRDEGAVIFGKTNLPRWSGDGQSYNEMFGVTNNPWDLTRTPGGSSGGAAAGVAAGLTSFEIGTDIGGSVRMPSHFTGVWGHKASYGIVPGLGYLDGPHGGTVDADNNLLGPLARSADDLDLLLGLIAGPSPTNAPAWRLELPAPRHQNLSDYRVAAWIDDPACPIDAEMHAVLDTTVRALEDAGAKVDRHARPDLDLASTAKLGKQLISAATSVSLSADEVAELSEKSRGHAVLAQTHHTWLERERRRTAVRAIWDQFFTDYDILLCPATVVTAFPHTTEGTWASRTLRINGEDRPYADLMTWTAFIGMAYLPVTTPPLGLTAAGLPTSVQVVAPYLGDRMAIDFARQLAELTGTGYTPPPDYR